MTPKIAIVIIACVLAGCATAGNNQQESGSGVIGAAQTQKEEAKNPKNMVTVFVDAHDKAMGDVKSSNSQVMSGLGDVKATNQQVMSGLGDVRTSNQQVISGLSDLKASNQQVISELRDVEIMSKQALETAQRSLQNIEEMSKRQGTGEITIFFPNNSAVIDKKTIEFDRLVNFADFLSRESKGRKIIFLSIGSASTTGRNEANLKLAKKRSETPLDILDMYLVNIPHEFHKVYGTGDRFSPKGVATKEHQRYQHTRIIALFDTSQAPALNEEAKAISR